MDIKFKDKVVVITGATGGIGKAAVKAYLNSGAKVAMLDVENDSLKKVEDEMRSYGYVKGYPMNLLDVNSIDRAVSAVLMNFGKIDVLVQVAGLMKSADSKQIDENSWDTMFNINTRGNFFLSKLVMEKYMKEHGGSIINFSSVAAIRGFDGNMASPHYSASKAALIGLSKQLAVEWGKYNIRVNSIVPGGVLTPAMEAMDFDNKVFETIPLKRLSKPEEIANTLLFLTSDKASMITGQSIVVDGGASVVGQ
ncbi:SDR family oxidoreductase [Clostridium baratii]|uniref:SDR family NAD(P)-dependent oxidoreductase n=1 Tax=Clostridium baratii TaxID=1561 RepID=UPI002904A73A|nr:SDR family oxidoreductase [Clostridium baratii]MDU1054409.1 SDR family oxidoreductase [Clostridium baratii]